ncbi:MAG: ATP-binding protein [Thermodesulfovibrionales bacterium]
MNKGFIRSISFKYGLSISLTLSILFLILAYLFLHQIQTSSVNDIVICMLVFFTLSLILTSSVMYHLLEKPLIRRAEDILRNYTHGASLIGQRDTKVEIPLLIDSILDELIKCKERIEVLTEELETNTAKFVLPSEEYLINTEKLASLGKMVAGIIHEINSPLTGIITFSHLILRRMPPERKEDIEDLQIIISQAERCSRFVSGLLNFSRQGMSQKNMININTLVEDTLSILKNQVKFQNINFVVQLDKELPDILVDENQIQQVFFNILINAADAMAEKGSITVVTSQKEIEGVRYVEVSFKDTGSGLPQELLNEIFKPFFTTKPRGQGTGLGLSVSNNIIKNHGGCILVESEQGKGATFIVRLPITQI